MRECEVCGVQYVPTKAQKYCSKKCRGRSERHRESHKSALRRFAERNPEYNRVIVERRREKELGVSAEEYARRNRYQKGLCVICGGKTKQQLAVDHNHKTGEVRGLLCGRCNAGLGLFQDDTNILAKAEVYVRMGGVLCG